MKKIALVFLVLASVVCASPGRAGESSSKNTALTHTLETNRSLLRQYHDEYMALKKEHAANPTLWLERKMKILDEKINALRGDSEDLQSFLPLGRRAREFVTDMMIQKAQDARIRQERQAQDLLKEAALKHAMPLTSPEAETTYQMHERALKFVARKRFNQAVKIYEEIVLKNPDDDEAYVIMGHTYLLMGQYQKAERAFHNAASIDPANIQEITPFYENAVLQNPDDDMAYANLGYALLILGDVLKAQSAFKEALGINPENTPAQNGMMVIDRLSRTR